MPEINIDNKAIAFILDWKKRTDEKQRKSTVLSIVSFTAAFLFCMTAFILFQHGNYDRIVKQNMDFIQDSAIQESDEVERLLDSGLISIANLAAHFSTLCKYNAGASTLEQLRLLTDNTTFDRIGFADADGHFTGGKGAVSDFSGQDFFLAGMQGRRGHVAFEEDPVQGISSMFFYAPVVLDDEIVGVLIGSFDRDRLSTLFSYQPFKYTPRSYLLKGDGSIICNSGTEEKHGNMLDVLSEKNFTGSTDFEDIMRIIADPERTIVTFSFRDGRDTSVGVIVQFMQNEWMLLSVLPHNITNAMIKRVNLSSAKLLISVAAAFFFTIAALLLFHRKQKKELEQEISLAAKNLNMTVQSYQEQLSIIESLVNVYSGVNLIDLQNSEYTRIKEENAAVRDAFTGSGGFKDFADEYTTRFVEEIFRPAVRAFMDIETFPERLESDNMQTIEFQRTDKTWRRLALVPAKRGEDGRPVSALFVAQRIDAEKEKELKAKAALQDAYEAARLANSAKTTFLANMSHDIRTPMNAIIGVTTIAASHLDDPERVSECLKKITSSGKHLLGLINDVLDMSKIESGKVDLIEEEFNLSELIDNLITIHQPLIRQKNHSLMVRVNNLTHEDVIGDSTRLQQVFANMLSNAIKYTPDGGSLEITITERDINRPTVGRYEVSFKDNGIGMTEEFQRTMFEPFSRADDARIANIQGTGLGMPIARNIAHMMNGEITVESRLNEGSTFTVSFTLRLQKEADVDYSRFVSLPVLVVDDDKDICEAACSMLDSLSMNSEWVTSGFEAVEKVAAHHEQNNDYYAAVIDWKMPDMDGLATTREIRRRIGSEMPIIVISAYDWSDIEQDAREAGVDAFISKPLFKSKLVTLFNELVNGKHSADSQSPGDAIAQRDFSGKRVLLVDDNDINLEVMVELLSMTGLEPETAENGQISVEKLAASKPGYYDLIFMDIQMPVMNGYEATRAIRALDHPDAQTIPIYAMTANAFSTDVQKALDSGMNGHLSKPVDIKQVLKVLDEHLG